VVLFVVVALPACRLRTPRWSMFPFFSLTFGAGSTSSLYTFDLDATLTPSELKLRHDFEQYVLLFEVRKVRDQKDLFKLVDNARFMKTRMVIRGRDAAHRKEIFGEQCRRSFSVYFACLISFIV
jgi:hypothetical protein